MGKVLKPLMVVAAIAVNFVIPGAGAALGATAMSFITRMGIAAGLSIVGGILSGKPKAPKTSPTNYDRLTANADPTAPRKIVFGNTAMAVDIRHQEFSNIPNYVDNYQGNLHRVFFHASHKVESIDEIWFDDRLAWTKTGGVQAFYIDSTGPNYTGPYLTVTTREEGTPSNTIAINGGAKWGSTRRCTGLAYSYMMYRLYGTNPKEPTKSPFSGGPPSRITIRGRGAPVYDPRQDTSVGGYGPMRADDQTTWAYTNGGGDIGRNPALQILWYMLGWRIQNPATGTWKLALGRGIPASRIDMASFMVAANVCDETVTSSVNGSEPRYRSDGAFSEGDDPNLVLDSLKAACNGEVRDFGGILSLHIHKNDLATVSVQLSDDDILAGFIWKQTADLDDTFNEVRGRYVDPSNLGLYQLRDYPPVRIDPPDDIERAEPFDLPTVQSVSQAQRIAKGRLAANLYRGMFSADFNARAWATGVGKIVELSVGPLGWNNKKFRVVEMAIRVDGVVPMVLREEHADIYLWDNSDVAGVQPFVPTPYDPAFAPARVLLDSLTPGATRNVWQGEWAAGVNYLIGDLVMVGGVVYEAITDHLSVAGQPPPNANWALWFATGATDGLSAVLTRSQVTLPASWDGIVAPADYAAAQGEWQIMAGNTNVTAQFLPIVTVANPGTLDTSYIAASYAVTGSFDPEDDAADLTMRTTGTGSFVGITFDRTFRLTKVRAPFAFDTTPPAMPTGLALSSFMVTQPDGSLQATLLATWNGNTEPDLAYYELSLRLVGGNFVDFIVGGATPQWASLVVAGQTYEAQLRAVDFTGNKSFTAPSGGGVVSHTIGGDTVAPAAPTGLAAVASFQNIYLSWTNPTAIDLARIQVWENTTNNSGTATRIATVAAQSAAPGAFTRSGLTSNVTRYYWLKAVDYSGNASGFSAGVSATTALVPAVDISGVLADVQIAALAASKITGQLTDAQLAAIAAAKITGQLATTQIADAAVTIAKFAAAIRPVEILAALPTTGNFAGRMVFLTTNSKLYRHTGSPTGSAGFVTSVASTDISGQLLDAQVAALAASKLTGTITSTQIADDAITTPKLAAGAVTAAEIAANTITAGQIAALTITAGQIAALTITGAKIAADTITSGQIAAGAISASELAAQAVIAGKIATGAIVAGDIAADTITGAKIAALTITSAELAAGSVIAGKIAAGTIVAADIAALTITGGKMVANTITAGQIASGTITATQIAGLTITGDKIAAATITANKLTVVGSTADQMPVGILVGTTGVTIGAVKTTADTGVTNAATAQSTANTGVTNAATAQSTANTAVTNASTAQGTANTAVTNASNAQSTANTAITNAGTAQVAANNAQSTANTANSTAVTAYGWSENPLNRANALSTTLLPGLVLIDGATTLSNWRQGGDTTKIAGGAISANTISANKLTIGNRGLSFGGIEFQVSNNILYWNDGYIFWMTDDGVETATYIASGSTAFTPNTYVFWSKGQSVLWWHTDWGAIRSNPNNVLLCTWFGGARFVANYGGTIVNGENITTGTINANRLQANTITAGQLATSQLISQSSQLGDAVVDSLKIAGATIIIPHVSEGGDAYIPENTTTTVLTSSTVTVGDSTYGSALVEMQGNWDGTDEADAYCKAQLEISINYGAFNVYAFCIAGCRTGPLAGARSFPYIPFKMAYLVGGAGGSAVTNIQARITALPVQLGGASDTRASYIRQPKIIIQGGKR